MSSPPPPGVYSIRNAVTGGFLTYGGRIGDPVTVPSGPSNPGSKWLLSREGNEYRIQLFKFGGPPIAVGIEDGLQLLGIPGSGDAWNIRPLIGSVPPAYEIFIAGDTRRHWTQDGPNVYTLENQEKSAWQFVPIYE